MNEIKLSKVEKALITLAEHIEYFHHESNIKNHIVDILGYREVKNPKKKKS